MKEVRQHPWWVITDSGMSSLASAPVPSPYSPEKPVWGLGGVGGGGEGERVEKQSLKATGYVKEGHRAAH